MGKFIDLTGRKFGRLTVIKRAENKGQYACWLCKCECGNEKEILSTHLLKGVIRSCGCLAKEMLIKRNTKHNASNTRLWNIYNGMKSRCYNKNEPAYKYYGSRGIKICKQWLDKRLGMYNFQIWAYNNGYNDTLSIDRIDVNGNYEPKNCRWVDMKVQANNKRNNVKIEYNGEIKTIAQWSKIYNISPSRIKDRLKNGWSIEDALLIKPKIGRNQYYKK